MPTASQDSFRTGRGPAGGSAAAAAGNHLATTVALRVLKEGGNAFDAAVAAAAVIAVVEPMTSQVGADAFALLKPAGGRVRAVNGSGPAPMLLNPEELHGKGAGTGLRSATAPGAVATWEWIVTRYGSWPLARVLKPAIEYCENGFVVCRHLAMVYERFAEQLRRFPATVEALMPGGSAPAMGDVVVQRDLGRTLRQIAAGGAKAFYRGEFAEKLDAYSKTVDAWLRQADLFGYECEELEPAKVEYRGYTVCSQPPVSQGCILLEELKILEQTQHHRLDPASAKAIGLMVGAKRLAFADRHRLIADPRFEECRLDLMLSPENINARARELLGGRRLEGVAEEGRSIADTTCLAVADSQGNEITFIQSVAAYWGSQVVVPGTGVLLNNRMNGFATDPAALNAPKPGKRPVHTLMTYFVEREGRTTLFGASMGGNYQPQSSLQFLNNVLNHGMDIQEAIDFPRWGHGETPERLFMESRFPGRVRRAMADRGYPVDVIGAWEAGTRTVAVAANRDRRSYSAASDQRWDGSAAAM